MDRLKRILVNKIFKFEVYMYIVKSSSKENWFNIKRRQDMLEKLFPWMRDWENAEIGIVRSGMTRMSFLPSRSSDTNL